MKNKLSQVIIATFITYQQIRYTYNPINKYKRKKFHTSSFSSIIDKIFLFFLPFLDVSKTSIL